MIRGEKSWRSIPKHPSFAGHPGKWRSPVRFPPPRALLSADLVNHRRPAEGDLNSGNEKTPVSFGEEALPPILVNPQGNNAAHVQR